MKGPGQQSELRHIISIGWPESERPEFMVCVNQDYPFLCMMTPGGALVGSRIVSEEEEMLARQIATEITGDHCVFSVYCPKDNAECEQDILHKCLTVRRRLSHGDATCSLFGSGGIGLFQWLMKPLQSFGSLEIPKERREDSEVKRLTEIEKSLDSISHRLDVLENASYDGTLLWKIGDFSRRKQESVAGKMNSFFSEPFYTSRKGYKMCARVYLNGDGVGQGTHLSLFFVIMRGEFDAILRWPFKQKVTIMLLDQSGKECHLSDSFRPDPGSSSFKRPVNERNISTGFANFVSHSTFFKGKYLKNDEIFIKIIVQVKDCNERV